MSLVLTVVLVTGAVWARGEFLGSSDGASVAGVPIDRIGDVGNGDAGMLPQSGSARSTWPPVPDDARNHPLGMPPAPSSRSGAYAFMSTISGPGSEPVRFDSCRPIHVVVNNASAPAGADRLLRAGLAEIGRTTGLQFVMDGSTDELPSSVRQPMNRALYGHRWSPVLVGWTTPAQVPELAGEVAGIAGPVMAPYVTDEEKHWVSGMVYLDGPDLDQILKRPVDGWWQAQAIVTHELGHLVGLTHVGDTAQLMAERDSKQLVFGDGDEEGLRRLGAGPCFS